MSGDWLRGDWMQTFTGRAFYPLDPRPEDVDPLDIAHALGMICRYGGHTRRFYSVAEHCVLMSQAVPSEHALPALLHDAVEAYVGDMVRPLKRSLPAYRAAEERVMAAICARFDVDDVYPPAVKAADNQILLDERAVLMVLPPPIPWHQDDAGIEPLGVTVTGWSPEQAQERFLVRLNDLLWERLP